MPHGTHEQLCSIIFERVHRPILRIPMTNFMDFVWVVFFPPWKLRPHSMRSVINSSTLGVLCELFWPQSKTVRNCTMGLFHGEWQHSNRRGLLSHHLLCQLGPACPHLMVSMGAQTILPSQCSAKMSGLRKLCVHSHFLLDWHLIFYSCSVPPMTGCLYPRPSFPSNTFHVHKLPPGMPKL